MQTVQVIQKPVIINANTYKMNFVRHTLPNGEVQDLEVIEFDESNPAIIELSLSDTEVPTLNFENLVTIQVLKTEAQSRAGAEEYEGGVSDAYAWNDLTDFEKIQRLQPELEAYFNQAQA